MSRRFGALALVGSAALLPVLLLGGADARAQAPDVAAWWNAANLGGSAPPPPAPPDVPAGDLLVQGSNAGPAASVLGPGPASAQAIAGLSFALSPTSLVGALTLPIDGTPPPTVSVVACRATETFTAADNGPWSQAPTYDATGCLPGKLDGSAVVFSGVDKLVTDAKLAVVLLPGPLDRVVFKAPGSAALAVTAGTGTGAAAPAFGAGTNGGPAGRATAPGEAGAPPAAAAPAAAPPVPTGLPAAATTSTPAAVPPVVAGSSGTGGPAGVPVTTAANDSGLSTGDRQAIGLAVIALEVAGFVLLARSGTAAPPAAASTGAATVGGRLRAPDVGAGRGVAGELVAGVGRFRAARRGAAPRL